MYLIVKELAPRLDWLNGCLTDRWHLLPISREKVWSSYHEALLANLNNLTELTGSRLISSLISLNSMKHLIKVNYTPPAATTPPPVDLTERDYDILVYVSGFILRKLKKNPLTEYLETEVTTSGLIGTKNRGGLIQPKEEVVKIVEEMEVVFRQLAEKSVNRDLFFQLLLENDIQTNFLELFKEVSCMSDSVDHFYVEFCNIFFLVRSHHKCRTLVEEYVRCNKTKRKSKAL